MSVDPGDEWLTVEQAADLVTGSNQFRENFDSFDRWLGHAMRNAIRGAISDGKLETHTAPDGEPQVSRTAVRDFIQSRAGFEHLRVFLTQEDADAWGEREGDASVV